MTDHDNTDTKVRKARQTLAAIAEKIETTNGQIEALSEQIENLETAGIANATEYWRDEKYLYLIYPMKAGERRRDYIGSQPAKVQAAIDSIDRFKRYSVLRKEMATLQAELKTVYTRLQRVLFINRPSWR